MSESSGAARPQELPLAGIRILDFTRHLPGPFCTDLLRRLGADVIKIEPPEGDPTRWVPPFVGDNGALFVLVNGGKRSVAVDLKSEEGRRFVHRLAGIADVVVESYRPGAAHEFGVDAETLHELNPRLIYCSISGYGSTSERSAHDLNFAALSGLLDLQRDPSGRPVLPSTQIGDMGGALFGALSIVAAIVARGKTGRGSKIDISLNDATRALMPTAEALYRGTHQTPRTFPLTGALPNYDVYRTMDGKYLAVGSLEPRFWEGFCRAIGHSELIPKQFDASATDSIRATIATTIAEKTRDEWQAIFASIDVCVEPVLSIEEAHARFGDPLVSHPLQRNFPASTPKVDGLGDSFEAVATEAGLDAADIARLRGTGSFKPQGTLKRMLFRAHSLITSR